MGPRRRSPRSADHVHRYHRCRRLRGFVRGSPVPRRRRSLGAGRRVRPCGRSLLLVHAVGRAAGDTLPLGMGRRPVRQRARRRDPPDRGSRRALDADDRHRRRRPPGRDSGRPRAGRVRGRARRQRRSRGDMDPSGRRSGGSILPGGHRLWRRRPGVRVEGTSRRPERRLSRFRRERRVRTMPRRAPRVVRRQRRQLLPRCTAGRLVRCVRNVGRSAVRVP